MLGSSLEFGAWCLGFLRRRVSRAVFIFAVICVNHASAAEVMPPKPDRYFNDYAGVVQKDVALQLNEKLAQFERETSNQIVVAVYPKMQTDSSVEDYAQRIAQSWGVGQKNQSRGNGVVVLVFIADRKASIQVGYGLEGALPDAIAFDIRSQHMNPHFRNGDYTGGLSEGIELICKAIRGEYTGSGKTALESRNHNGGDGSALLFLILFIFLMIMISRAARKKGYGYARQGPFVGPYFGGWGGGGGGWSGGSSGGGFSGFSGGGGGFGGGGSSGSW